MDSTLGKIAIPLAAGGISAYSPRYGASGVQGALSAWRGVNDYNADQQHMKMVQHQQEQKDLAGQRIQDFFRSSAQTQGSSSYGGGGASGNVPAADMSLKSSGFDVTGKAPQAGFHLDPIQAQALQAYATADPEGAIKMYAEMASRYKPPDQQKPERHYTDFINPDNQKVTNVLTIRPDGGTNETNFIAGDVAKPAEKPNLPNSPYEGFLDNFRKKWGREPSEAEILGFQKRQAEATREPKDKTQNTPQIQRRLDAISARFGQEQAVKDAQTLGQAVAFMDSLSNEHATPADDQAAIYAFAKAMDPNSAVREGEYKTVQQYSQALLETFGMKAKRVFTNSGLLTPEARAFMKQTIRSKYASVRKQYDALEQSYRDRLENAKAGGVDLVDYGSSLPSIAPVGESPAQAAPAPIVQVSPSTGRKRQSLDGGKTWQEIK